MRGGYPHVDRESLRRLAVGIESLESLLFVPDAVRAQFEFAAAIRSTLITGQSASSLSGTIVSLYSLRSQSSGKCLCGLNEYRNHAAKLRLPLSEKPTTERLPSGPLRK